MKTFTLLRYITLSLIMICLSVYVNGQTNIPFSVENPEQALTGEKVKSLVKTSINYNNPSSNARIAAPGDTLLFDDFETGTAISSIWTVVDGDASPNPQGLPVGSWTLASLTVAPTRTVAATSWYSPASTANDWLISEPVLLDSISNYVLNYQAGSVQQAFADDYEVHVCTGCQNATFNTLLDVNNVFSTTTRIAEFLAEPEGVNNRSLSLNAFRGDSIRVAFRLKSTDANVLFLDNIFVGRTNPVVDLEASSVSAPASGCEVNETTVDASISSVGQLDAINSQIELRINSTPVDTITIDTIKVGADTTVTFTGLDFTADNVYLIEAIVLSGLDSNATNDTVLNAVQNTVPIDVSTTPFTQNWDVPANTVGWEFVNVNADDDTWNFLNNPGFANSGTFSVFIQKDTNLDVFNDWIIGNCIDLTGGTAYNFTYNHLTLNSTQNLTIAYGNDPNPDSLTTIISIDTIQSGAYTVVTHSFTPTTTGTYYFGLHATTPASTNAGGLPALLIDDIVIGQAGAKDVGVAAVNAPLSSCDLSATSSINATIENFSVGAEPLVEAILNINNVDLDTIAIVNLAGNSDSVITFTADLSTVGTTYNISVRTELTGDVDLSNDTATDVSIHTNAIDATTTPYTNDIEILTTPGVLDGWITNNANLDGVSWGLSNNASFARSGTIYFFAGNAAPQTTGFNDWIISNCVDLVAGNTYDISFWTTNNQRNIYEIAIGNDNTPAALTTILTRDTIPGGATYTQVSGTFTPATNGRFYVGIHVLTPAAFNVGATSGNARVDDIRIGQSLPDIAINDITFPTTSCDFPGLTSIPATIANTKDIPLTAQTILLNAGSPIDTVYTQFTGTGTAIINLQADLSVDGAYNLRVNSFDSLGRVDSDSSNNARDASIRNTVEENVDAAPFTNNFDSPTLVLDILTFNENNDAVEWTVGNSPSLANSGRVFYNLQNPTATTTALDDWFVTTCFDLDQDSVYQFSFFAAADGDQTYELFYGTDNLPSTFTNSIATGTVTNGTAYNQYSGTFTAPATASYHIGLHVNSPTASQATTRLRLDDIAFEKTAVSSLRNSLNENKLSIYPNPSEGLFTIEIDEIIVSTITVTNVIGETIQVIKPNTISDTYTVDLSSVSSGTYFVTVESKEGVITKSVVVSK